MRLSERGAVTRVAPDSGVGASWSEVVRRAYLLTADHGTAEELAVAAHVQERRRRLARSPGDARRLVLMIPLSLAWQLKARSRRRPDADDPFLAAYLGLSPRERALLVLRVDDGLDGPAAATTLGLRPKAARELTVTALDALRVALPSVAVTSAARHDPTDQLAAPPANELDLGELTPSDQEVTGDPLAGHPVVPRLAALFAELSAAPPVMADPARRVDEAAARQGRRRRRLTAVAAGLVVTVVGSGAVLQQRHAADLAEQQRAERRRAAEAALNPVVQSSDVTTWPTRGSLAGRADLIAEVLAAAAQGEDGGVVRGVPFVGEVAGLDVALVLVEGSDDIGLPARRLIALSRRSTQPVAGWERNEGEFELERPGGAPAPVLHAVLAGDEGEMRAVVVTVSSGIAVAVSARPAFDVNGVPGRRYTAVPLRNGVGTATWRGIPRQVMIRSQYLGGSPWFDPVWVNEWQEDRSARPVRSAVAASCRGTAFRWARNNLDDVARDVAGQVGGTSDEVALAQAVGCRRAADRYVMIVGVRLADGTALQTALEEKRGDGESSFSTVGARSVPRGREASYPRVVRLGDEDAPDVVRRAVLFAAPGGATAELVSGPSTVLARARLGADGVGVGTAAGPLRELLERDQGLVSVVVRDAAGKLLERVPVPAGHETEPEDPEGPVDPPVDGPAFPHRK